jgi:2-oxoisovalerate dehydrogenase E1 component
VLNTPLAESACTGYAIGLAVNGHRPIEEFQFADFSTEAVTQITLNAATFHFRSGGKVPLVLRLPCGGGLTFGSFHSQELESLFLSMPGLKALYPSTPQDAFNALLAAYEDDNPVLLFEHKGLYRRGKEPVAWDPAYREVWRRGRCARRFRHVRDLWRNGAPGDRGLRLFRRPSTNATFDLWDLRCLSPLNLDAIEASLAAHPPADRAARRPPHPRVRRRAGRAADGETFLRARRRRRCASRRSTCRCRSRPSWNKPTGPPGKRRSSRSPPGWAEGNFRF